MFFSKNQRVLFLFLFFMAAFAWGSLVAQSQTTQGKTDAAKKPADKSALPAGNKISDFTLKDLNGKEVDLSDFAGKVIFLEFWATWCPDCKRVLPHTQKLFEKYKDKELALVTVSVDTKTSGDVPAFMKDNKYSFPVLMDGDSLRKSFQVRAIPTVYIIDRKGMIRAQFVEYREEGEKEIERIIAQLLDDKK
jgi:peroxiredoxin